METVLGSDFVGKHNSFNRSELRAKERLCEQVKEAVAKKRIYSCLMFSASPEGCSRSRF
jgi:hypothetical protein